jgi:hypothetical protein
MIFNVPVPRYLGFDPPMGESNRFGAHHPKYRVTVLRVG